MESDLTTARDIASAMADESFLGQKSTVSWIPMLSKEGQASLAQQIHRTTRTLAFMLQPHTPSGWRTACQRAKLVWSGSSTEDAKMTQLFSSLESDEISISEFEKYRSPYEVQFGRMLADFRWVRDTMRRPS